MNLLNYNNNKENSEISTPIQINPSSVNCDTIYQNQHVPIQKSDHLHVITQLYSDNNGMDCKRLEENSSMF